MPITASIASQVSTHPPIESSQSGQEVAPGHVSSFCIISGMDELGTEVRRGGKGERGGREFKENRKGWRWSEERRF